MDSKNVHHVPEMETLAGEDYFVGVLTRGFWRWLPRNRRSWGDTCCGERMQIVKRVWKERCKVCGETKERQDYRDYRSCRHCKHVRDVTNYGPMY